MTIRKLSPKTQQGYIRTIKNFSAFLGRSPDKASFEDVRRFQLHLAASGASTPIRNQTVAALRFLFRVTLRRSAYIPSATSAQCNTFLLFRNSMTAGSIVAGRSCGSTTVATIMSHRSLKATEIADLAGRLPAASV